MIDLTSYDKRQALYLLKANSEITEALWNGKDWASILSVINNLGIKLTEEQITYAKSKLI